MKIVNVIRENKSPLQFLNIAGVIMGNDDYILKAIDGVSDVVIPKHSVTYLHTTEVVETKETSIPEEQPKEVVEENTNKVVKRGK